MQPLDTLALIGEVLSWIGLGIGVPLLIVAALVRLAEGPWRDIEIAVVDRDGSSFARWFAGNDFHERPLRRGESGFADAGWGQGVVNANNPARVRFGEPPHLPRVARTLGTVFTGVGILGLIGSVLPLFF